MELLRCLRHLGSLLILRLYLAIRNLLLLPRRMRGHRERPAFEEALLANRQPLVLGHEAIPMDLWRQLRSSRGRDGVVYPFVFHATIVSCARRRRQRKLLFKPGATISPRDIGPKNGRKDRFIAPDELWDKRQQTHPPTSSLLLQELDRGVHKRRARLQVIVHVFAGGPLNECLGLLRDHAPHLAPVLEA